MRAISVVTVLLALSAGCVSSPAPRRSEAVMKTPFVPSNDEEKLGQRVYMMRCNGCHPQGDAGIGPALNNKPLPRTAMHTQIRLGVGAMPGFNEKEISDEELKALDTYIVALRMHR